MEEREFTPTEKVTILRKHLVGKVPLLQLCDEYGLRSATFYLWQEQLFERGVLAFREPRRYADFIVSKSTNMIHRATCRWVDNIASHNAVEFDSLNVTLIAEYGLCGTCFVVQEET